MAAVLDALASYVIKMLLDMVGEGVAMMIGVSYEINDLVLKLTDLKNFLADADRRKITDDSVRGWVAELKRAMYEVTDILDLCQLKVMEDGPSKDMGWLTPLLSCMWNPLHVHDIGTRIKTLNQKLDEISKRGGSFGFIRLETYQDTRTVRSLAADRKTDSLIERSGTVGEKIEEDMKSLVKMLTEDASDMTDCLKVVAIVGIGGIGKTTLAKKVFNDRAIQGKFSKKIWLSITKDFSDIELLRTAIIAANGELPGAGGVQDKDLLAHALRDAIKDKKFFLVLDDMWGVDEWNKVLLPPFSYGGSGSRVLITTRYDTVGRGMKAVHCHHIDKLGPEDAWSLLKKQVLTTEKNEPEIDMLKDIGLQIIEKCDGLPLAVKVMGGLLCKKEKTRRDWSYVLNDDIWSDSQMPEQLNYAIYLSYEDLPPFLKQCFLHFSLKPKNTVLSINQIVSMWIGEGLVQEDTCSLEEGKKYYMELILRNLIEIDTNYPGNFICKMHDVICSFAQFMARGEALVAHSGDTAKSKLGSPNFLRLSIDTRGVEPDAFEWKYLIEQKSLRTLILTGSFRVQSGDSLISFSSLRTLHIESADFGGLVDSVHLLKHLRYLALTRCTGVSSLPERIHEMKFLQHISVEDCESFVKLPESIIKLPRLRYLGIDGTNVNSIPSGFGVLTNLKVLCGFPASIDGDWCSLEELGPLLQLRELGLEGLEIVSSTSSVAKAMLGAKEYLTKLVLSCRSRVGDHGLVVEGVSAEERQRIEGLFDVLCPPSGLEYLSIKGYFGRQLPRWMMWTAALPLDNLRTLFMHDMACCTELPDGLCRLSCLEFLGMCRAPAIRRVGPEFVQPYNHNRHSSSAVLVAFPRLHKMLLDGMVVWEEWEWEFEREVEVQAMPVLEELQIHDCKLRYIPPGLAFHARALKKLTISCVKGLRSLENFASVAELELYDIPYLTRISKFSKLQKLEINLCPKLESVTEMTALRRVVLTVDYSEKQLPVYLQTVKPSHLMLDCSPDLILSMAELREWERFIHIQHVEAYGDHRDIQKKWHLFYTSEPFSMETNIHHRELS